MTETALHVILATLVTSHRRSKRAPEFVVLVAVCGATLAASLAAAEPSRSMAAAFGYECYVTDTLTAGIVPNTVQAAGDVDCSGYGGPGSVVFTVRLKKYDGGTQKWTVVGTKARRYTTLRVKHPLAVSETPCVPGAYRGTYTAVLRNAGGGLVSVNLQKLQTLHVTPGCGVK